ncbi:MAG: hypothetical protein JEZ02_16010 [Desulfatibacillum sp.]|nr:hypothetical protein [Desulfatibacillum sp.]
MLNSLGKFRAEAGVTLLELIIYIGISSIVAVALAGVVHSVTTNHSTNQNRLELKQEIQAAMNMLVRDLRMAGCDPNTEDDAHFGLLSAQPQSMNFVSDFGELKGDTTTTIAGVTVTTSNFKGDGKSNSPGEDVTYFLSAGSLMRRAVYEDGLTHTETLLENVTDLQFNYRLTPTMPTATISAINYVNVVIEAESQYTDRVTGNPISIRSSSLIHMRNKTI